MSNQIVDYCDLCEKQTIHLQPATSHVLHLLLSIVTVGFWVIAWVFIAKNNASQSKCSICGRESGVIGSKRGGARIGPTPETHVKCPDCAELIKREARICKHCGCKLIPQ